MLTSHRVDASNKLIIIILITQIVNELPIPANKYFVFVLRAGIKFSKDESFDPIKGTFFA